MPRRTHPSTRIERTSAPSSASPSPFDNSQIAERPNSSTMNTVLMGKRSRKNPKRGKSPKGKDGLELRDPGALLNFGETYAPFLNSWTDSRIEQVRAFKHWTFVAIDTICRTVSSQIPNISWVKQEDEGVKDPNKSGSGSKALQIFNKSLVSSRGVAFSPLRSKALLPLQTHEELHPVPHQHPLRRLLLDPNSADVSYDFWYETLLFLMLTGSAYWWMPRNKLGLPAALHVIPSHWCQAVRGTDRLIDWYEIRPVEGNFMHKKLPADDVIHFRFKSPISKIDGYSKLSGIARWHDIHESMNQAKWNSYRNGTFPTVAIQFDSKIFDPTDEQLRRIEAKFYGRHVGETRSNKPLFLPPGVKVVPLSITPNEMVFGETAEEMRDAILSCFGMNTAVVNGSVSNTSHTLAAMAGFYSLTINPLLRFMGQVITEKLGWLYDEHLRVWWEDKSPDDPAITEQRIMTDLMGAALSPNEIRAMRGREPWPEELFPGANLPIIPVNMQFGTLPAGGSHSANLDNKSERDMPAPEGINSQDKSVTENAKGNAVGVNSDCGCNSNLCSSFDTHPLRKFVFQ